MTTLLINITLTFIISRFIYQYCQTARVREQGEVVFETKSWCPPEDSLQSIAGMLVEDSHHTEGLTLWIENFNTALEELRQVEDT